MKEVILPAVLAFMLGYYQASKKGKSTTARFITGAVYGIVVGIAAYFISKNDVVGKYFDMQLVVPAIAAFVFGFWVIRKFVNAKKGPQARIIGGILAAVAVVAGAYFLNKIGHDYIIKNMGPKAAQQPLLTCGIAALAVEMVIVAGYRLTFHRNGK